jgi:hypothetical protein
MKQRKVGKKIKTHSRSRSRDVLLPTLPRSLHVPNGKNGLRSADTTWLPKATNPEREHQTAPKSQHPRPARRRPPMLAVAGDGKGRRRSVLPKERPSGRLIRLLAALRPSRTGPLPVQTGFPTSLADLVVKNHGRLKKHPSPSTKRGAAASPSPLPSPSTPTSPSLSPPAESPPPPTAADAVSPSDRPRPDHPPAQPPRRGKGGGFGPGLGLGFLAVSGVVASLALLVIWSKVVAAVTVASFSLYLLESVRSSSLPRRRPGAVVTERRLPLDGRGRVSPIREVDAATEPSRPSCCSDSDRGSDGRMLLVEESSGVLDESSNLRAKAKKKSWKKLLASAKKLHRGRRSKEAGSSGCDGDGDGSREGDDTARGGGNAKAADSSGSRRGAPSEIGAAADEAAAKEADSSRGSRGSQCVEVDAGHVEIDASVDDLIEEEEEEEQAGIRSPALVLVAIVLVGLVAGKVVALAVTVLCSAFLSSVQRSPCACGCGGGGGCSHGGRLELSMP